MANVIVIFGTLIALNLGFGYWLSEKNAEKQPPKGVVEVENVQAKATVPAASQPEQATDETEAKDAAAQ